MNKKGAAKEGPKMPEDWPTNPQSIQLILSNFSFQQTNLRIIENKPPFMRCLINTTTMSENGIHTDLPLLASIGPDQKKIVVHAWPSFKLNPNECALDDQIVNYLNIPRTKKQLLNLTPIDQFYDYERIVVNDCPIQICKLLPSIYSGLIIGSDTAVFFGNHCFDVSKKANRQFDEENENQFYRVVPKTLFISTTVQNTSVPLSFEAQYEQINGFLKQKKSILLSGPSGCGKTLLINCIISTNPSLCFFTSSVPSLLSGSFGVAERTLRSARLMDVVVLENAEVLGSDEVSRRLIAAICDVCESPSSTVIITTTDSESFPKLLRQLNRVSEQVEIQAPTPEERLIILRSIISKIDNNSFDDNDIIEASKNATGFVGGDLQRLVSESIVEGKKLTECVSRIKPMSLRHITLEVPEVHWNDIGGYELVKSKLKESVTLPLERPECFTKLGIRPPRGVLLFGPPGCSKTLMAKAVATESKMNFIAVKGPELFSKFVGESEKAVASVFKKARSASPSIIFFDEIDAMATRRGANESSGSNVTDRVLTQLLTEMDGVSTKFAQSVVVIAATNRPDLLDPALLRPGRFDRLVYISLPDLEARREIFRVHISKMKFEQEILDNIQTRTDDENDILSIAAKKTDGYSGAEIAAVCREAAMNALRENPPAMAVSAKHFWDAIDKVKPRTPESLLKWYEEFEKQRKY